MDKKTILIIDDEQINLDFFDVMLSRLGFNVLLSSNGEEGLELTREHCPDLIILDNIMPRLTGWEFTRILKQDEGYADYKNIPIIMFSAMDAVKDKIEGFNLGIEDYITKPFNFSEVLARIRAVLRSHELSRQVLLREKRLALTDSLKKSLIYFNEHLHSPVMALLDSAQSLNIAASDAVEAFKCQVQDVAEQTLAALGGLKDEIDALQANEGEVQASDSLLNELEEHFFEHFREIHNSGGIACD
ncbi:MAG: response regulator [Spirochaeta sp. LUC14_002_19_P3]|nr:MAG: response regulator [Spirochaeta sp. LUC14_002_19_P3]